MKPAPDRGRFLFLITATAIVLERLVIAGMALTVTPFSWTNFLMPVTHIAVVVFLAYTADVLIYWLVILWGLVTAGTFAYNLWDAARKLSPEQMSQLWTTFAGQSVPVLALAVFHFVTIVILLSGPVRRYLAKKRQVMDQFEGAASEQTPIESGPKTE
jgi:hypothetical protein